MKKIILSTVAILGLNAGSASAYTSSLNNNIPKHSPYYWAHKYKTNYPPQTTTRITPTWTNRYQRNYYTPTTQRNTRYTPYNYRSNRTYTRPNYSQNTSSSVSANVRSHLTKTYQNWQQKIPALTVSIRHRSASNRDFANAALIQKIGVKLEGFQDINPEYLGIEVDGQVAEFDRFGRVDLQLRNFRIPAGNSDSLEIQLVATEPQNIPNIAQRLKLHVTSIEAYDELTNVAKTVNLSRQIPTQIIVNPTGSTNAGTGNVSIKSIQGGLISAGSTTTVMQARIESQYDDIYIKEFRIRDKNGNTELGNLIDKVLVRNEAGTVIASGKFYTDETTIRFAPDVRINRGTDRYLQFDLKAEKQLNASNKSIQLEITPGSIEAYSASNGNPISLFNTRISSEIFTFSQGGIRVIAQNQNRELFAYKYLEPVFDLQIANNGSRSITIGRMSFLISPDGVDFVDGISTDDFELVMLSNSGREISTDFVPTINGNIIYFDAANPLWISKNQTVGFRVKSKFENNDGNTKNDAVVVRMLSDTNSTVNSSYDNARAAGYNFIWSDEKDLGRGTRQDIYNGFNLNLPTNAIRIKR